MNEKNQVTTTSTGSKSASTNELAELANFLYSEYKSSAIDKRIIKGDDEADDPFIEIQEIQ